MAVTINGTTGVSQPGDFSSSSTFGFKNRILNGDFRVAQRGTSATITANSTIAAGYSTVDRFYVYCTGANVTAARTAGSGDTQYWLQITGAASVTAVGVGQRIEQANCYDLAGKVCTLSVDMANSLLTTVTWTAYYANTANNFGTLASPTRTQIATGTFTVNSVITNYEAQIAVPEAATTGIEIVFTVGAQTSGTWSIANVQLESGSSKTSFERVSYPVLLNACKRYYEQIGPDDTNIIDLDPAFSDGTTAVTGMIRYEVEKRTPPTVTLSGSTGRYTRSGTDISASMTFSQVALWSCTAVMTTSGLTAGAGGFYALNTGAYLQISAEL